MKLRIVSKGPSRRGKFAGLMAALGVSLCVTVVPAGAQVGRVDLDTVRAGSFDFGKMWTFEYAPSEYFTATYGFEADPGWFDRARLSVLRIPGCSASFVSPNGLVATNHHCVRGMISRVARDGESLLDDGFVARSLDEERRDPGMYADQLIAIEDVSDEVFRAIDRARSAVEREQIERETLAAIEARLQERYAGAGDSIRVQIVPLYHGGRYSAYVFRRFTDVRLVVAAELQMAFFGGDADNFTYPRYDLDFAFLRVYDGDGRPYQAEHHMGWSEAGVEEGDAVFVIGSPGSTNRLRTLAQLEYQRDVEVPVRIRYYNTRLAALEEFGSAEPAAAEALDVRNRMFGLSNSLKARSGQLEALRDPVIMTKKWDAERQLWEAINASAELRARYGGVFASISDIQEEKRRLSDRFGAFYGLASSRYGSAVLRRAFEAYRYLSAQSAGAPSDSLEAIEARLRAIGDWPRRLELGYLEARFADFEHYLGAGDDVTRVALQGRPASETARALFEASALGDSQRTAAALSAGQLSTDDPAIGLVEALLPAYSEYVVASARHSREEGQLESDLGRVRFEVYGRSVPPDGTSSPRITDGVVLSYNYNGTVAPPYTTFFGLYDRYNSHGSDSEWNLPERWRKPPPGLSLGTPLNFISTADTYGGNSGSPAVTPQLDLVGLNFDRNIEGLSRDFIYLPERGRNIMVDARAIRAALDHVYDADRIVLELQTGGLFATEEAADAEIR
ncbi:MAG: S46 family peptidase [Gemmatimonadales bacterium]|jgi:hypothetical protein